MGHKKRPPAPSRSKHQQPPPPPPQQPPSPSSSSSSAAAATMTLEHHYTTTDSKDATAFTIKQECERALTSLRRGNHMKAVRLMKDLCSRHGVSHGLVHRVQGTVCVKVATIMDDPGAKLRFLRNAIDSARRAVELSPNSIEFAHFYANLMFEAASSEGTVYDEVLKECDRALEIENPIDPAKESLQEESQMKVGIPESRVEQVRNELRNLKQKVTISSLSSWMKTLSNGEQIRLIPIGRAVEDPMEIRLQQSKRPNEIKKVTKTLEERRKEIEVRVTAARLVQQKMEAGGEVDRSDKGAEGSVSVGGSDRGGERRKYGSKKNGTNTERKDRVLTFWNSMDVEMKRDLLRIRVSDLKGYFGKDGLASEVLNEALLFAEEHRSWRFWACCRCGEKFSDSDSHMHHVVHNHMGNLLPKMQAVLPLGADNEWIDMILSHSWKPVDVSSAVEMLLNQEKSRNDGPIENCCSGNHNDDCFDCFKDAWDSTPEKEKLTDECNDSSLQSNGHDNFSSIECKGCCENLASVSYSVDSWPMSNDSERMKLLQKIRAMFEVLIRNKCLAESHLNKVVQYTIDEIQNLTSGTQLLNHGLDQSPLCICFLEAPQLKKVLKFLQELSHYCGLGRFSEKSNTVDDTSSGQPGPETREKVVLNGDASCLYLDESLFTSEFAPDEFIRKGASDNASYENGVAVDVDVLLSWIFSGPSSGEQLQSWMQTKDEKMNQGLEILQMREKEFYQLQSLCERKCEHLSHEEVLQSLVDMCLEESRNREVVSHIAHRSFDSVLRKRREELLENGSDAICNSSRIEIDVISNVLKEFESLSVNQFGYENAYVGLNSQLCDLESGDEDYWRTKDYMNQVDTCIEIAVQRQKEQLSVEISKTDARIMRTVNGIQQSELKLEPVSAHDYQLILLPLVKSYMRSHLEDLAEKDATEKSDAAREAFLAELALDSKNGAKHDKSKDKRKNREHSKTKDHKAFIYHKQHLLLDGSHETADDGSLPLVSDSDHLGASTLPGNANGLEQQEEELRCQFELEQEEKKLQETLEYQRRVENEAKLKHLAEQQFQKSNLTLLSMMAEERYDVAEDGANCLHFSTERFANNNGLSIYSEGMSMTAGHVPSASGGQLMTISHESKVNQGLPNGGIAENGFPLAERRVGRRGRRQKSSSGSFNGKHPTTSFEKENVKFHNGDGGTKTLRQLQAEEDDDERFQAEIKTAVKQSLDTFQAHRRMPVMSSFGTPLENPLEVNADVTPNEVGTEEVSRSDVFGAGLKNDVGDYNCFLNVIIQSLWHVRRFRDKFLERASFEHVHVGDPCVVCSLYDIFTALSHASIDAGREAVAPTSLRVALSNLRPESNFFQEAEMNDASEVLEVIFDCLHHAFASGSAVSGYETGEGKCTGVWDCANKNCIVHSLFGMDIMEQMNCHGCGLESRHMKYTAFFHNINASSLREMKAVHNQSSFDELVNLVEINHQVACNTEEGGCGKPNYIYRILSTAPHVFTTVLGWQNTCESIEDISATLAALSTDIDLSILYRGLDPKSMYTLVSVVCYYGQHYHCFTYNHDSERWIMFDDKTIKVIGSWEDVLNMCERGHLQPQVLFFESGR